MSVVENIQSPLSTFKLYVSLIRLGCVLEIITGIFNYHCLPSHLCSRFYSPIAHCYLWFIQQIYFKEKWSREWGSSLVYIRVHNIECSFVCEHLSGVSSLYCLTRPFHMFFITMLKSLPANSNLWAITGSVCIHYCIIWFELYFGWFTSFHIF